MVPDFLVRSGIRKLCKDRLMDSAQKLESGIQTAFLDSMTQGPIAPLSDFANEQHYEVPAEFFDLILGPRAKYSCCYFEDGECDLELAENVSLQQTCERAELVDGQDVLELGCGWGSLTLFAAEKFPNCNFTAISNSASQRRHIEHRAQQLGLNNICLLYTSPSPRDRTRSRMPSSA